MANIGKIALVVTANAAPLTQAMDAADKKVKGVSKSMEQSMSSAGGGMAAFFGGAAGGAIGVGLAAVARLAAPVAGMLGEARKNALALGVTLGRVDHRSLERVEAATHGVKAAVAGAFARIVAAAEPAITAVAALFVRLLDKGMPAILWLTEKGANALSIGFQAAAGTIGIVADQIGRLSAMFARESGTKSFFDRWAAFQLSAKDFFHVFGLGFAVIWDSIKAGLGFVMQGFAEAIARAADLLKAVKGLSFRQGPFAFDSAMFPFLNDGTVKALERVGNASRKVGQRMVFDFGQTQVAINRMFDGLDARMKNTPFIPKPLVYQPSAALAAGTREEYSARARFGFEGIRADVEKQQLEEQKRTNQILSEIRNMGPFRPGEVRGRAEGAVMFEVM